LRINKNSEKAEGKNTPPAFSFYYHKSDK